MSEKLDYFLQKNGVKKLSKESFHEKLTKYFGIESFNENIIVLFNYKGFEIDIDKQFLNTYPFEIDYIEKYILDENLKNEYNNKFIAYNKIIFNDDISAITSIMGDKESREDIFFYSDYEKNIMINRLALNDLDYKNFNPDYIQHLFLYNNHAKQNIKNEVIAFIVKSAKNIEDYFINLITNIFIEWNNIFSNENNKFQLIANLLENILKKYEKENSIEKYAPLLNYTYSLQKEIASVFVKNIFFEQELLMKYSEIYFDTID